MKSLINENLKQYWQQQGYIKLNNFFDGKSLCQLSEYVNEIAAWPIVDNKWMTWLEKTKNNQLIVSRIENFLDYHPQLKKLIFSDSNILSCIAELLDDKPVLFKERIIFKYPDSGGYKPHQDAYSVAYNLPQREVYAVLAIFLDDADEDNGCMYFSVGHHLDGILPTNEHGVILEEIYRNYEWQAITCKAGDIVVFDNYMPHYSEMNESNRKRRVIYFPFQKQSTVGLTREQYYIKKRQLAPPESSLFDPNALKAQNNINNREQPT